MRDKHLGRTMTQGAFIVRPLVFAATLLAADWAGAQLRVSSIDWVQGRPEIPHPALNNRATILMAIAEGGGCGGNYQYRWDINGMVTSTTATKAGAAPTRRTPQWSVGTARTRDHISSQPGDRTFIPKWK